MARCVEADEIEDFFTINPIDDYIVGVDFTSLDVAKKALKFVLSKEDCAAAVNNALNNLKDDTGNGRRLRENDLLELFDNLNSQERGGIRVNSSNAAANKEFRTFAPNVQQIGGGGGLTFAEQIRRDKQTVAFQYVHAFRQSASTKNGSLKRNIRTAAYKAVMILIHEMFHGAGDTGTFSEDALHTAARATNSNVRDLEQLLRDNCVPNEYH